jgi:hypothetical protein
MSLLDCKIVIPKYACVSSCVDSVKAHSADDDGVQQWKVTHLRILGY